MIQCKVTVSGIIKYSAEVKQSHKGDSFVSFGLSVPFSGSDGSVADFDISVSLPGGNEVAVQYKAGTRVEISGVLTVRKRGESVYYNLRSEDAILFPPAIETDSIRGTVDFKGKIGKVGLEHRKSRKGKDYYRFSAFSSEKTEGDNREFTWMNFSGTNKKVFSEEILKPGAYVHVTGDLQVNVWKGVLRLECRNISLLESWGVESKQ